MATFAGRGWYNFSMTSTLSQSRRPGGLIGFFIVWAGQFVSVLASTMTQFALTIWVYEATGSATILGVMSTAFVLPFLLFSPFAGAMVDRYNRKLMMMVSDLVAVTATAAILILQATGRLDTWHLFVAAAFNGLGNTFQWPAYSAAISTMIPKQHYSRANGMMSLIESGPAVLAPLLAGVLMPIITLTGILVIDVVTFFVAIGALLIVHIPQPERTVEGQEGHGNLLHEAVFGFRYIFARRSLLGLLLFFVALNLIIGLSISLFAPFILASTDNNSATLGAAQSAAAIGAVVGSLLVSAWGGFRRRMHTIFLGEALTGLFGLVLFSLGKSLPIWAITAALGAVFPSITNGASQAIWQAKVAPDVQGRVFATRRMIAMSMNPITPILAGLLADTVTGPAMQSQTWLAAVFGPLLGTGPGSGMALQLFLTGIAYIAVTLFVFLFVPLVRNLEDLLPDHDQLEKVPSPADNPASSSA